MTHLSLFSGIGGLDIAAEWAGFRTVGQCEWADYPTKVLEKHWPDVSRWRDIRTLTRESFYEKTGIEKPTVVSGGFPCQPHSCAGHRLASDDERDLWNELCRVFCETDAGWLVAENVGGLLSSEDGRFFGRVLRDLAQMGCVAWWFCFPAHATGADFWGERVALVAAPPGIGWNFMDDDKQKRLPDFNLKVCQPWGSDKEYIPLHMEWPIAVPSSGYERNDDGLSEGVDRLTSIGNAVYPRQFYPIFVTIARAEGVTR